MNNNDKNFKIIFFFNEAKNEVIALAIKRLFNEMKGKKACPDFASGKLKFVSIIRDLLLRNKK